ncbi:sulfhydryl oxidase 2 isoform X2 [Rhineura floridana]|uniref:sulfhydryl oxidase 2 isoform X2 n=1 Tax=Rhineura floridana TaxID=261503 RepID=UPI002AC8819C|nr:sulfhydryl oxidase 2 isoform X2 [Rhineura floridana]
MEADGCRSSSSDRACLVVVAVLLAATLAAPAGARLYQAGVDPVWVLEAGTVLRALRDSPSAWLVQFYSSACGHCVAFAPTWRALAGDVHGWEPVIRIGVLDCGDEGNHETCKEYGIQYYPTFRYFRAFTKEFTTGENQHGSDREVQTVRQTMIDFLQNHSQETKPPACPPLEPIVPEEMFSLFDKNVQHYTAIIFESANSYVGQEVILDLSQYENITVKRMLNSDAAFLEKFSITSVPSSYLIYPNGSHGLIKILKPLRSFFSSYLKSLPGVRRKLAVQLPVPIEQNREENLDFKEWKHYDKSKLYMADLESGLHYLLRVELATHKTLEGAKLMTFKDVVILLAKLFPGHQPVMKLLETLQVWLLSLPLDKIPYDAILDLLNNKMRISGLFLSSRIRWVGCQGSRPERRGYPCSFWELFHTLTVQAAVRPKALLNTGFEDNPRAVLQIMQKYVQEFFGCRACAQHFEEMARESLDSVKSLDEAVVWLWKKHNVVNARLAGGLNEDPKFPKAQWPTPDVCPACHEEIKGPPAWNEAQVLQFLKRHYDSGNFVYNYTGKGRSGLQDEGNKGASEEESQTGGGKSPDPDEWLDSESRILERRTAKDSSAKGRRKQAAEASVGEEGKQAVSFLGVGFSNIDMSLCILLYVASSLFLMIMYFFFRMRSKRWKVRYYRPYV